MDYRSGLEGMFAADKQYLGRKQAQQSDMQNRLTLAKLLQEQQDEESRRQLVGGLPIEEQNRYMLGGPASLSKMYQDRDEQAQAKTLGQTLSFIQSESAPQDIIRQTQAATMQQGSPAERAQVIKSITETPKPSLGTNDMQNAAALADLTGAPKDSPVWNAEFEKQMLLSKQGGVNGESKQPVAYIDPKTGKAIWGNIGEARGKEVAMFAPDLRASVEQGKETGKTGGEVNWKDYQLATVANESMPKLGKLVAQLESSKAITGLGADIFKNIERAKTLFGNKAAAGKVSDTELLDVMMGSDVFPMIQSLGVGAKGMDTPAEREFMRNVLAGQIQLNKETLLEMTRMRQRITQRTIDKWNSRVGSGELDSFFTQAGRSKQFIGEQQPSSAGATSGGSSAQPRVVDW